jgi:hypothetical protein
MRPGVLGRGARWTVSTPAAREANHRSTAATYAGSRFSELEVRDAPAPRQQLKRERQRVELRVPDDVLEVPGRLPRGLLEPLHDRLAFQLVLRQRCLQLVRPGNTASAFASEMASSIASLVPLPIVKCAVCAASPSSTTFPWCHDSHRQVTNDTPQ